MAKILIVDDEIGIRDLLSEILRDEGHMVETAENAATATLKLREHRPELVLLDIWLPDQDGIELHAKWCSDGLATMPVVVMSGHATIEHAITATRQGAADFLEKPISLPKLLSVVENVLSVRRPRSRILQLSDFASIEPFRLFGRRLSQASSRNRVIYLEGGDEWMGELCSQTLCSGSGKMIKLIDNNEPLYLSDVKNGSVIFAGELKNLNRIQQKNFKFAAESLTKKNMYLIFYTGESLTDLVELGWEKEILESWMANVVKVPLIAHLGKFVGELAQILLNNMASRDEVLEKTLSVEASDLLSSAHLHLSYSEFIQKLRNLASHAVQNKVNKTDVEEVFHLSVEEQSEIPFSLDQPYRIAREQFEQLYFSRLLKRENGVISRIAERSGIERTHLYRKLKQIGLFTGSGNEKDEIDSKQLDDDL